MKKNIEANYPVIVHYMEDGESKTVSLRRRVPLSTLRTAVQNAIGILFSDGNCEFILKHLAVSMAVVDAYTDYEGSFDADEFLGLVDCTNFYTNILAEIDSAQYFRLEDAIEEEIEARLREHESDRFFADLRDVLKKWDGKLSRMIKPKDISALLSNLSKMDITEEKLVDAIVKRERAAE